MTKSRFLAGTAILIVLAVSSCTSSPDPASPSTADASGDDLSTPGSDWDLSQADLVEAYEKSLPKLAEQYFIGDPPAVELVRFVSTDDWPEAQASCMAEQGFSVRTSQGGLVVDEDVPEDQGPALNLAFYSCAAAYPPDPRSQSLLPRVRAEQQFEYWTSTVAPCLREQGIDVSEPPSLATWLDRYYSRQQYWDPFADERLLSVPAEELDRLYLACPRDAPNLYPPIAP